MEDFKVKISWVLNGNMDLKIKSYTVTFKTEAACKMYDNYSGVEGHKIDEHIVMKPADYETFEEAVIIAGLTKSKE